MFFLDFSYSRGDLLEFQDVATAEFGTQKEFFSVLKSTKGSDPRFLLKFFKIVRSTIEAADRIFSAQTKNDRPPYSFCIEMLLEAK